MTGWSAKAWLFTDAHSPDTVCTPSRYGLLTGRYSWRTGMKKGVMGAEGKGLIAEGRTTLASLLRDSGYRTAMVGKWHLGLTFHGKKGSRDWSRPVLDGPVDKGFDYFYGIPASMNYGVLTYIEDRRVLEPPTLWDPKETERNRHRRLPDHPSVRLLQSGWRTGGRSELRRPTGLDRLHRAGGSVARRFCL